MSLTGILRVLSSAMQTPVIFVLLLLAAVVVAELGMLVAEALTERRQFKVELPKLADQLQAGMDPAAVINNSGLLARQKENLLELLRHPQIEDDVRESLAVNMVTAEQSHFTNRVKITDYIAKASPMVGLMGTLIPLGPGLIAIGQGDTALLSQSLLIAFDTTIMGLAASILSMLVSTIRKSWYVRYQSAFETAAEAVLVVASSRSAANEPAVAAPAAPVAEDVQEVWSGAHAAPAAGAWGMAYGAHAAEPLVEEVDPADLPVEDAVEEAIEAAQVDEPVSAEEPAAAEEVEASEPESDDAAETKADVCSCSECGAVLPALAQFCTACGAPVQQPEAEQDPAAEEETEGGE